MKRSRPVPSLFAIVGVVLALSIPIGRLGAEEDRSELEAFVDLLLDDLERGPASRRESAAARLAAIGRPAFERARARIADAPTRARVELLGLFGREGGEAIVERLIAHLDAPDRFVGRAARDALLDQEPGAVDLALRRALAGGTIESEAGRQWATDVVVTHLFEIVERSLRSKVAADGSYGFYDGQFADLAGVGEEVGPVVLTIFARGGRHRYLHPIEDGRLRATLDFLAGEALTEVVVPSMQDRLEELLREAEPRSPRQEVLIKALHTLGHSEPLKSAIAQLERSIRRHPDPQYLWHDLATLYYRMGDHAKTVETYGRLLAAYPRDGLAHYNRACSQVRLGDLDAAVDSMRAAWNSGYDNLDWARRDGDLAGLRADAVRWGAFLRWVEGR